MGVAYRYGVLSELYSVHHYHFCKLHDRAKKVGTDLTRDRSGLLEFIDEIGPLPSDMKRPTVGRKDHDQGYVRGNYEWQSHFDNNHEMALRTNSGQNQKGLKRSPKTVELLRISHAGKPASKTIQSGYHLHIRYHVNQSKIGKYCVFCDQAKALVD